MKVGILGSGVVGKALAAGFLKYGYDVTIGTRSPEKLSEWLEDHPEGHVDGVAEAARFGDIVVLAVDGAAAEKVLGAAGSGNLEGKVIIDVTNPIADVPPENGVLKYFTSFDASLMEQLQRAFPGARFVKAFNSVGNALMVDPELDGGPPTMFICGNDDDAKHVVAGIVEQFGWDVADMGGAEAARAIEPLAMLWCIPGILHGQWTHAFKLLR